MAYNENTVQRIRGILQDENADFFEKKMFSGVCFMVNDKMCCGTHIDKDSGEESLLCRIGETACEKALAKEHVTPMAFTGKIMKGCIFVTEEGFKTARNLAYWLQMCLGFNPMAKASRKR
jgi:hypothetical protein